MGKNWACHNLAKHAKGDYLIFVDADTVAKPSMLPSTMSFVLEHNIKAGSGIPIEDMKSFGELITVPFMYWGFLAIFPYFLSNRIKFAGRIQFGNWAVHGFREELLLQLRWPCCS